MIVKTQTHGLTDDEIHAVGDAITNLLHARLDLPGNTRNMVMGSMIVTLMKRNLRRDHPRDVELFPPVTVKQERRA